MSRRATCQLCGVRFDRLSHDSRRWKIEAKPIGDMKIKPMIVCTRCFLEVAEPEYGA